MPNPPKKQKRRPSMHNPPMIDLTGSTKKIGKPRPYPGPVPEEVRAARAAVQARLYKPKSFADKYSKRNKR